MNKYSPIPEGRYTLPKVAPDYNHVNNILSNLKSEIPEYYDYCFANGNLIVMDKTFRTIKIYDFNEQLSLGIWNF